MFFVNSLIFIVTKNVISGCSFDAIFCNKYVKCEVILIVLSLLYLRTISA